MSFLWTRRKRRKPNGSGPLGVKSRALTDLHSRVNDLLNNRWQLLVPQPFTAMEVYSKLFTPEEFAAIELIRATKPTTINMASQLCVALDDPIVRFRDYGSGSTNLRVGYLELDFDDPVPSPEARPYQPENHVPFSILPQAMRNEILAWIPKYFEVQYATRRVVDKVDRLFNVCSTLGQIYRVWPNITTLMNRESSDLIAAKKVRSPYPDTVLDITLDDYGKRVSSRLREEWTPEALQWYDDRLTEALCLPHDEHSPAKAFTMTPEFATG